jgi:hypothetical protein
MIPFGIGNKTTRTIYKNNVEENSAECNLLNTDKNANQTKKI